MPPCEFVGFVFSYMQDLEILLSTVQLTVRVFEHQGHHRYRQHHRK
jgi:hypothetical protein